MRSRGGVADLPPRAEALVRRALLLEHRERRAVHRKPVALAPDRSVPVDAQRPEVVVLGAFVLVGGRHEVEVLGPEQERLGRRPRREPCDQGRAEVAKVQVAGRRRCESAGHRRQSGPPIGPRHVAPRSGSVHLRSGPMECHVCGTPVRPEQKFCMECGARLHHTQGHDLALAPPEAGSAADERVRPHAGVATGSGSAPDVRSGHRSAARPAPAGQARGRRRRHECAARPRRTAEHVRFGSGLRPADAARAGSRAMGARGRRVRDAVAHRPVTARTPDRLRPQRRSADAPAVRQPAAVPSASVWRRAVRPAARPDRRASRDLRAVGR